MEFFCQSRIERQYMKTKAASVRNSPTGFFPYTLIAALLAAGELEFVGTARAADFYWINPGGGDWGYTNNWSPSRISPPDSGDNVFITLPGAYNVTGNGNANSLTLGNGVNSFPTLLLDYTGVSVSGAAYAAPGSRIILKGGDGSYLFGGGSFSANGGLTLDGELDWQAGILGGSVTITTNGVIAGSTSLNHALGATIYNHGQILWSANNLTSDGSWLQNMPDGLLDFQNDGVFSTFGGAYSANVVINNGLMLKSAGTGILDFVGPYFVTNTGVVKIKSGILELFNNVSVGGTFTVSNGAALWLEGGTFTLNPGYVFNGAGFYGVPAGGNVTINGTIADANFQMNGTLYGNTILAGTMTGNSGGFGGTLTIATNGVLNIYGCTSCGSVWASTTFGGVINNGGTMNWLTGDTICYGGSSVYNLSNALFNIWCDNPLSTFGGSSSWFNAGTIRKSAGTGTNAIEGGILLTTVGLVDVESGGMNLQDGFTSSGNFNVTNGSVLLLNNGTYNLNPGHNFTGGGFYGVPSGGNVTINGTIAAANFQMNGTLYGSIILAGTMTGNSGGFEGTLTVASNGVLNIYGCTSCGSVYASTTIGGVLNNGGTMNWLSGDTTCYGGSSVYNLSNALFNIQCDNPLTTYGGSSGWVNAGTIRKSASVGTNAIGGGILLTNVGLVDVESGGINLQDGFTSSGTFNVTNGAALLLGYGTYIMNPGHNFTGAGFYGVPSGGNVTINGTIAGTNFQMNGTLSGSNTLSGTMWVNGAYFQSTTTVASNATMNVNSISMNGVFTNAGTVNWLSGNWLSYSSTIENLPGALFNIECDAILNGVSGPTGWHNAGIIRKSAGIGTTQIYGSVYLTNDIGGLFQVQNGTVNLENYFTCSSTCDVSSGATLTFAYANLYLNPGHAFTGAGFYGITNHNYAYIYGTIPGTNFQLNGTLYGNNALSGTMWGNGCDIEATMTIANSGTLNLLGGAALGGSITNSGTLNWLSGNWTWGGGLLWNQPGGVLSIECDAIQNGSGVLLNAGTVQKTAGAGTTAFGGATAFTNTALLDVQSGTILIQGPYGQTGGQLNFGLAGPSQYGKINISDAVSLTGELSANLLGGYAPAAGDTFNVLTTSGSTGVFDSLGLPALPGIEEWSENYGATVTSLIVMKGRPRLVVGLTGGNFAINWTTNADSGFVLQSATNLAPPVVWQDVTNSPQIIASQNVVTLPLTGDTTFFRLHE
jgi:hypothetical protein